MGRQPETFVSSTNGGEIMPRGIDHDLFASLMRLSARERTEILEFLGQSPVAQQSMAPVAYPDQAVPAPDDWLLCGSGLQPVSMSS